MSSWVQASPKRVLTGARATSGLWPSQRWSRTGGIWWRNQRSGGTTGQHGRIPRLPISNTKELVRRSGSTIGKHLSGSEQDLSVSQRIVGALLLFFDCWQNLRMAGVSLGSPLSVPWLVRSSRVPFLLLQPLK